MWPEPLRPLLAQWTRIPHFFQPAKRVSTAPLVELIDVAFSYDEEHPVLSGVTLAIPRGKVVAIMGGSGSGKTTILRLIGGALRASGYAWPSSKPPSLPRPRLRPSAPSPPA